MSRPPGNYVGLLPRPWIHLAASSCFSPRCCQALLLTNAVTLIAISALAGYALAENKAFATLPSTTYVIGAAIATFPASMWMKRVGRRNGFLTGGALGLAGAMLATFAVSTGSFALLCAGRLLLGHTTRSASTTASPRPTRPPGLQGARRSRTCWRAGSSAASSGPSSRSTRAASGSPDYAASYASLFFFCLAAMAIISFLRIPPPADSRSHEPARPLSEIAAQPVFIVAVGVAALGYAVMNLLMTATPLAMGFCGHPYDAAASVIAAHVVAMFAPSFFTGSLIKRFGVLRVMLAGVAPHARVRGGRRSSGQLVANFWWALVLLGVGWNFMYIGGTTLLTEAYRPAEKAKAQGVNEITIFAVQALSSFTSGVLVNTRGWDMLNYVALPLILIAGGAVLVARVGAQAARRPAYRGSEPPGPSVPSRCVPSETGLRPRAELAGSPVGLEVSVAAPARKSPVDRPQQPNIAFVCTGPNSRSVSTTCSWEFDVRKRRARDARRIMAPCYSIPTSATARSAPTTRASTGASSWAWAPRASTAGRCAPRRRRSRATAASSRAPPPPRPRDSGRACAAGPSSRPAMRGSTPTGASRNPPRG